MNDKPDKKENVQLHLEALFQASETIPEAPADLKEKVFNTLKNLETMAEIVNLFTVKFVQSNLTMIDQIDEKEE